MFYCVANMPGAVPNTSTYALTNATLPYAVALADKGWQQALRDDRSLALGLNTHAGELTNAPVGEAVGIESVGTRYRPRVSSGARLDRAVRTYLDHLAVERGLAVNTLSSYRRDLRRYDEFLTGQGIDDLDAVTEATVAAFLVEPARGDADHPPLSATSAARTVVAVRGFHKFAVSDGLATADPAAAVSRRRPRSGCPRRCRCPTSRRSSRRRARPDTALALRDRALLELLYGTGARISEAVGLDVDDLDQVDGTVLLRGKGGKERLVPVGGYARDAVAAYLDARRGPSWSVPARARPGDVPQLPRRPVVAAERVGGAGQGRRSGRGHRVEVSPHTLRHSFATHLLDGGADVRVVQELLGHASVTTTQVYTLVTVDNLREVFATAHPRARE